MKKKMDFTWDTGWTMTKFSRLFHQVSGKFPSAPDWAGETNHPPMDIFENDASIQIQMEVPGMSSAELSVKFDRDKLTIEGFKHRGSDIACLRYLCVEREFGIFRRVVDIPGSVDASGVKATLVNGVLRVVLPKVTERRRTVFDIPVEG